MQADLFNGKKYGSSPNLMFEDTFNPSRPQVRTMKEEIERTAIGKLLNDKWINAQKTLDTGVPRKCSKNRAPVWLGGHNQNGK